MNHTECNISTGIHECLTVGQGELDHNGFWEIPCYECARRLERECPDWGPVWPHTEEQLKTMFPKTTKQLINLNNKEINNDPAD